MKRKRYTEEQIAFALRQHESGTAVEEILRKMGISEPIFYRWKKKFGGLEVGEVRRLKQLEEENKKLKQLVVTCLRKLFGVGKPRTLQDLADLNTFVQVLIAQCIRLLALPNSTNPRRRLSLAHTPAA